MDQIKPSILYVDDEKYNLITFKAVFREYFTIYTAITVTDAWEILKNYAIEVVISDYKMPEMNGLDFLSAVQQQHPGKALILSSGLIEPLPDISPEISITLLPKPWDEQSLLETVNKAIHHS